MHALSLGSCEAMIAEHVDEQGAKSRGEHQEVPSDEPASLRKRLPTAHRCHGSRLFPKLRNISSRRLAACQIECKSRRKQARCRVRCRSRPLGPLAARSPAAVPSRLLVVVLERRLRRLALALRAWSFAAKRPALPLNATHFFVAISESRGEKNCSLAIHPSHAVAQLRQFWL
jgi:hypothetical protein